MRIAIIGAGNVGTGLGRRLRASGHDLMLSFTRTPDALAAAAEAVGGAGTGTPEEAARWGEVVILATPWAVTLDAVHAIAAELPGKVLWDCTNPLKPDMSGLALGTTNSGGEEIERAAPGALVVKAVPPFAEVLHAPATEIAGARPGVFVCADDEEARRLVTRLVGEIGADAVQASSLALARYTEPLGMLLVQLAYAQGFGARIGIRLLREATHA